MQEKTDIPVSRGDQRPSFEEGLFKVGILLPLSGPHKKLGESLQKTVEWGYLRNLKDRNLALIFEDSEGTSVGAVRAMNRLIQKNVRLVLGPVFSQEAKSLKSLSKAHTIPVLSLSNDRHSAGSLVYVLGTSPVDQMRQSLAFAAQQGIRSFVAFLPSSEYGAQLAHALPGIAQDLKIRLSAIKRYSAQNPYDYGSFDPHGVEGIFIPEGAPSGQKILESLFHQGIDMSSLKVIGSSLWETMSTLPEGGFFAAPDQTDIDHLLKQLEAYNGGPMPKVAALLYDSLFLVASLKDHKKGYTWTEILTQPQGFKGLEGAFRIKAEGYTEKPMAIYQVHQGQLIKIQPAPEGFTP